MKKGLIDKVLTTNLVYQPEDVLSRDYYVSVDMSKYIALLIDTLNHDQSISELLNPTERIQNILKKVWSEIEKRTLGFLENRLLKKFFGKTKYPKTTWEIDSIIPYRTNR